MMDVTVDSETENGLRLYLLVDYATNCLRTFMHNYLPEDPTALCQFLNQHNIWKKLNTLKQKGIIRRDQWNCIFPCVAPYEPDSKQFDAPTIILLLKTSCNIDQFFLQDMEDLRRARNKFAHSSLKVTDAGFKNRWDDIERPLISLGGSKDDINNLKTCRIDPKFIEHEKKLKSCLEQIEKLENCLEGVWWGVLPQIKTFVGREEEIYQIHDALTSEQYIAIALHGLSGVGKSGIARAYCHKYGVEYYDGNVIWINAEDKNTTEKSFIDLSKYIGFSCTDKEGKALDGKITVARVYNYFCKQKCLFVFDNTQDYSLLQEYLPSNVSPANVKPFVLVTSQFSDWASTTKGIKVNVLTKKDSHQLLSTHLSLIYPVKEESIDELADLLGCLPLALNLAIAYIKKHNINVTSYITRFQAYFNKIWIEDVSNLNINSNKTVLTTWDMAFAELNKNHLVIKVIEMLSILDGKSIAFEMLLKLYNITEIDLDDVLDVLSKYSLIDIYPFDNSNQSKVIRIHSLVQKAISYKSSISEYAAKLHELCSTIKSITDQRKNIKQYSYGDLWSNHVFHSIEGISEQFTSTPLLFECIEKGCRAFWNKGQIQTCKEFANCAKSNLILSENEIFKIDYTIAKCTYKEGSYNKAKNLLEIIVASGNLELCSETEFRLRVKRKIGKCLQEMGYYTDAIRVFKDLALQYEHSTEENKFNLKLRYLIANCLMQQGKLSAAKEEFENVYQEQIEFNGTNHRHTLTTRFALAVCLQQQGFYERAMIIHEEIYNYIKDLFGDSSLPTLNSKHEIARCLEAQGMYQKALDMYEEVYKQKKQILGESHPSSLSTKHEIASCLEAQGLYDKAMDMYEEVYFLKLQMFGESNPSTLSTAHEMANCLLAKGMHKLAMELYEEVYVSKEERLGELHPATLVTKNALARCLQSQDQNEEAMKLYEEIYSQKTRLFGELNPSSLVTRYDMARCLQAQGLHNDAMRIYEQVYKHEKNLLGELNPSTLATKHEMAGCLFIQGMYETAMEIYEEVLEKKKEWFGDTNPSTLATKSKIANCLRSQDMYQKAEIMYEDIYNLKMELFGECNPSTLDTKQMLASCYQAQGLTEKATHMYEELYAYKRKMLGDFHYDTLVCKHVLATCLFDQGLHRKAFKILTEVYVQKVEVLGESHPSTAVTKKFLADYFLFERFCCNIFED